MKFSVLCIYKNVWAMSYPKLPTILLNNVGILNTRFGIYNFAH